MRVLQLGPFPPPHGGVQTNIVAIRDYLRSKGHGAGVVNITRNRRENADEVYYPKSAGETLRLMATLPYDILHLHIGGTVPPRLLALALACSWMPGRKSVLSFHSGGYPSSPEGQSAAQHTLRGFVFRQFDRIIAVNQEIADLFRRFGVSQDRIRVIEPHALPATAPDIPLPERMAAFFASHKPVLLSVGLLEPEYDLPSQIRLLGRLREKYPDAGLLMIGSGSLDAELRSLIAAQPYSADILLYGDSPHAATLRAIAECTVFLRTTLYDGDAVSVREALHLGAPVIATDNGMRPEGVYLTPISDADGLLATTLAVLKSGKRKVNRQAEDENMQAVLDLYAEL